MKAIYVQQGKSVNYINTGSAAIAAGEVVPLTTRIGIAATDIPKGALGAIETVGVFELPKESGIAITVGAAVYYAKGGITTTETNNTPAGWATAPAAADDTTVRVKID